MGDQMVAKSHIVMDLGESDEGRAGVISLLATCIFVAIPIHFNIIRYLR